MRRLGRKTWIAAGVLVVLSIMLFIYSSYSYLLKDEDVVNGIYVSGLLLAVSGDKYINYCKLLRKATENDSASIRALTLLKFGDGTAYDHGGVVVDLIEIVGEDKFIQSLATINNMEKNKVSSYLMVGLAYGKTEFQGKTLKEAFPKIYTFLDDDRDSVIEGNDIKSNGDSICCVADRP